MVQHLPLASHSKKIPRCSARLSPCLCWFSAGTPASSRSPRLRFGLFGDSKLSVGVKVSVNGCLSLCVGPVIHR